MLNLLEHLVPARIALSPARARTCLSADLVNVDSVHNSCLFN